MKCFITIILFIMLGVSNAYPMTPVAVNFKGQEYTFQYELYDEPMILDFKTYSNDRSTPLGAMKAFFYTKAHLKNSEELNEYRRTTNGELVPPLPEKIRAKFIQACNILLNKEIIVYGQILFEEYTIYKCKLSPSTYMYWGTSLKKFNDNYFVIYDLPIIHEFVKELSKQKYDIEKIRSLYEVKK